MTNQIEQFFKKSEQLSLSQKERGDIRMHLNAVIQSERSLSDYQNIFTWQNFLYRHTVSALIVAVLLVSGATTTIADSSFPGDTLYPIKTGINEKVLGWFARSEEGKNEWQVSLAERRLKEVEYLAKSEPASSEDRIATHAKLETHTRNIEAQVAVSYEKEAANESGVGASTLEKSDGVERKSSADQEDSSVITTMSLQALPLEVSPKSKMDETVGVMTLKKQIQEHTKKLATLRRELNENRGKLGSKALRLRSELLLTEKALFDSEESLSAANTQKATESFEKAKAAIDRAELLLLEFSKNNSEKVIPKLEKDEKIIESGSQKDDFPKKESEIEAQGSFDNQFPEKFDAIRRR